MKKGIKISGDKKIEVIQKEFNDEFPFLKIEFFQKKHTSYRPSHKKDLVPSDRTLRDCNMKQVTGTITLRDDMKVSELEEQFQNVFGLSAQIFRKSGGSWIETTVTDDWTLARQNEAGRELSSIGG